MVYAYTGYKNCTEKNRILFVNDQIMSKILPLFLCDTKTISLSNNVTIHILLFIIFWD